HELLGLLPEAALSIAVSASPDPVPDDSSLTYTVQLTNAGPDPAQAVVLNDALPAASTISTTFLSLTQTAGPAFSCTTPPPRGMGTVTCSAISMAPGVAQFLIVVHVDADPGSTLTNVATVSTATPDLNLVDNSATVSTQVSAPWADLLVTQSDDPDPVTPGNDITYTLTLTNAGPSDG